MNDIDLLASPGYRDLLRDRYTRKGWGASGKSHVQTVEQYARQLNARSILDYGCGRGTLKTHISPRFDVREYDPGIVGKDELPGRADLVVCTDVLEHIEPDRLENVLEHLHSLMVLGGFFTIALGPAKEVLGDGRNAHLIQQPIQWWLERLRKHRIDAVEWRRVKGLWTWVVPCRS